MNAALDNGKLNVKLNRKQQGTEKKSSTLLLTAFHKERLLIFSPLYKLWFFVKNANVKKILKQNTISGSSHSL